MIQLKASKRLDTLTLADLGSSDQVLALFAVLAHGVGPVVVAGPWCSKLRRHLRLLRQDHQRVEQAGHHVLDVVPSDDLRDEQEQIEDAQAEVILDTAEQRGHNKDEPILQSDAEIYLLMHALDVDYELAKWFHKDDQEEKDKLEKLPLADQLLHYQNEIDRIKSYEDPREKSQRERRLEHEAKLKAWSEEQAERNRLQAESLDGPTFLKAVQSDEKIGGMGTSDYGAGSNYGWRTIPPTTIWGRDKNHGRRCLVSNPAYEETIDSWQIDDGPPNTLV